MQVSRKHRMYLRNLLVKYLNEPDKWSLEKGDYMGAYWYYYTINVYKNDRKIKFTINPSVILYNTIEIYIDDTKVYKLYIVPLSYIFRLIISLRIYLMDEKSYNIHDEKCDLIESIIKDKCEDVI